MTKPTSSSVDKSHYAAMGLPVVGNAFLSASCNFSIKPNPLKPVNKAGSRFATA